MGMSTESDPDTSRTVVQTYVPAYQRDSWDDHAEKLGMSRSEFVKTMVQAGRSEFGADIDSLDEPTGESTDDAGENLDDRVLDALSANDPLSWDELLAAVTDDIENRLEETLQEMQSADKIRYSGRDGGYVIDDQ